MFKNNKTHSPRAEVKDGALILYLPTALKPCVWRMDLATLAETSIEIDEKDGIHILATRDINGVTKPISAFNTADDAQNALSLTLKALMSGSNKSSTAGRKQIITILKWLIVLLIAFLIWVFFFDTPIPTPIETAVVETVQPNPSIETSVEIDVDSFFEETQE